MRYVRIGKPQPLTGAVSIWFIENGNLTHTQTMQAWLDKYNWEFAGEIEEKILYPLPEALRNRICSMLIPKIDKKVIEEYAKWSKKRDKKFIYGKT